MFFQVLEQDLEPVRAEQLERGWPKPESTDHHGRSTVYDDFRSFGTLWCLFC